MVFEFEAGQWFRLRDSIREPIRLGEGPRDPGPAHAAGQPVIELWEAQKHADLFETAFGRRLEIEPKSEPEPARSLIV